VGSGSSGWKVGGRRVVVQGSSGFRRPRWSCRWGSRAPRRVRRAGPWLRRRRRSPAPRTVGQVSGWCALWVVMAQACALPSQKSKSWIICQLELSFMELRQLAYFVAVVEKRTSPRPPPHACRAAGGECADSAVGAGVRHELLDRGGRTVRLTEMGGRTAVRASRHRCVEGARSAVDELAGLVRGHVAMGMVTSHNFDIAGLLAGFHEDYPGWRSRWPRPIPTS